jgi:hypothetical protein
MTDALPRVFTLSLVVTKDTGPDPYIGIRHLLKLALRRYGLRCVEARELGQPVVKEKAEP